MRPPEPLRFTEAMLQEKTRTQRGTRPLFNESMTGKSDLILVTYMAAIGAAT